MQFANLGSFIAELKRQGSLVEVDCEVDPYLEIAEIHRRVIAAGGPALLFRRVKNSQFPVVTNLFGSEARVNLAFGQDPKDLVAKIAALPEHLLPPSAVKLWRQRGLGMRMLRVGLSKVRRAPVLEARIAGNDLRALPALTSWREDGGPFLTLPLVHTRFGQTLPDNLGMYRVQIHDAHETGMHFQIGKGGGFHLHEAEAANQQLPVNIYLGGPPSLILAAIAPLPENIPELLLASLVLGQKLAIARKGSHKELAQHLEDQPLPVAEAEFCLMGHVPPKVRRPEGPFGDHYGYYSLRHDYPVFRPKAIYHRRGAVFPATVVGKPRQEDFFIGDYLQELLFPLLPKVMPGVLDLWSYGETGYHALSAAVLKERYGRESLSTALRILGEGQLALTKFLIATDQSVNLRDFKALLQHVLERVDWREDLLVLSTTAMDTLDYCGPAVNKGSKGILLGMGAPKRRLPTEFTMSESDSRLVEARVFAPGCLVVQAPPFAAAKSAARDILQLPALKDWPLVVVVDNAAKATRSSAAFLWTTFTRFDPASDIAAKVTTLTGNKIIYEGPVSIDARMKPWYPDELFCDPDTKNLVDRRWSEYFPSGKVSMGDSDMGHLDGR